MSRLAKKSKQADKDIVSGHRKKFSLVGAIIHLFKRRREKEKEKKEKQLFQIDRRELAARNYRCKGIAGVGTFGVVYLVCPAKNPRDVVAVKRIDLDNESETREVDVHKLARHRNVVSLREHWTIDAYHGSVRKAHIYMVMDYLSKTLEDLISDYAHEFKTISTLMINVFSFQMFRALNYLHSIRVMHRDVKPSNLLVDMKTGVLKICDFGCRFYRAPELVLNNYKNDENIDIWAAGCVLAECFRGWPLFPGKSSRHQFGAIADVLGNPTRQELFCLNPKIQKLHVKIREADGSFDEHFPPGTPESAMDLLARILVYPPKQRVPALVACADRYYDQLRSNVKTLVLPSGAPLPPLFDFSPQELRNAPASFVQRLMPQCDKATDECFLHQKVHSHGSPSSSIDGRASIDSISAATDEEWVQEVFSELESLDVEESDLWDCQKVQVLDDDVSIVSDGGVSARC